MNTAAEWISNRDDEVVRLHSELAECRARAEAAERERGEVLTKMSEAHARADSAEQEFFDRMTEIAAAFGWPPPGVDKTPGMMAWSVVCEVGRLRRQVAPPLEEAIRDQVAWIERLLQTLEHRDVKDSRGTIVNGFAGAFVPDWDLRQKLDSLKEDLAAVRTPDPAIDLAAEAGVIVGYFTDLSQRDLEWVESRLRALAMRAPVPAAIVWNVNPRDAATDAYDVVGVHVFERLEDARDFRDHQNRFGFGSILDQNMNWHPASRHDPVETPFPAAIAEAAKQVNPQRLMDNLDWIVSRAEGEMLVRAEECQDDIGRILRAIDASRPEPSEEKLVPPATVPAAIVIRNNNSLDGPSTIIDAYEDADDCPDDDMASVYDVFDWRWHAASRPEPGEEKPSKEQIAICRNALSWALSEFFRASMVGGYEVRQKVVDLVTGALEATGGFHVDKMDDETGEEKP